MIGVALIIMGLLLGQPLVVGFGIFYYFFLD